jgi:glycosyltransferase involved in cell wall biosynthesis
MRLAILMPVESPWSRETALRIAELGHEVHVIDFHSAKREYLGGRKELHAPAIERLRSQVAGVLTLSAPIQSQLRYVVCARQLRKICRRCGAEILLTLWGGGWATMSYLSRVRPYAVFVGGGDILRVAGVNRWISQRALNAAEIVFANGKYFAARAREFAPKARIVPLYYGVDTEKFAPGFASGLPLRIICTRGFSAVYNNDYLVRGLAVMPDSVPEFRVTFTSPGSLLEETRSLADEILPPATRQNVEFLNGVTDDDMVKNLQASHVYVSLSRYDGTSISLLEALSCGLFPVLSDIPQNREWIDPALGNGILVPLDQPKALAEALVRALSDEESRQRAAEINRRLIIERADGRRNMAILATRLESIVHKSGKQAGDLSC